MAEQGFGKFKSIDEFLESYKAAEVSEQAESEQDLPFEEKVRQRSLQTRAVVEVAAKLREREDGGNDLHLALLITVTEVKSGNDEVNDDVQRVLTSGDDVFLAVRVGDGMGITKPIVGLTAGVGLDVKGEWIPKEKAFAHGGRALSVLHFTHHPLGFICVDEPAACYS